MAIRYIPPEYSALGSPDQINLMVVNFNPHDTICPVCRQYIGRIYTYGGRKPPHLPLHDHCYCWFERTKEGLTPWLPEPPTEPIPVLPPPVPDYPPFIPIEPIEVIIIPPDPGYPPDPIFIVEMVFYVP